MAEYIDREAVLEFVEPDARPFLAERIKSIPAADVREVKRGVWKDWKHTSVYIVCSACGEPYANHDVLGTEQNKNFCPNCGADMREES